MSAYVTTAELSQAHPFGIYQGPRTGDVWGETTPPGMGDISTSFVSQLVNTAVQKIEIRSQLFPTVVIDRPLDSLGIPGTRPPKAVEVRGGTPFIRKFLAIAKPAAYIQTAAGEIPIEPFGRPTEDYSVPVMLGAFAVIAGSMFVGIKIGQRMFCPAAYAPPISS